MANPESAEDLKFILSEHRRELMAAETLDSDLDIAFNLQLEEAIAASISHLPSSSSSTAHLITSETPSNSASLQTLELSKLEQEVSDRQHSIEEMKAMKKDLDQRIHDQKVAQEIMRIPEEDWIDWGDEFGKPFGEGCSKSEEDDIFRLYFKGLVSEEERVGGSKSALGGIGVAICDPRDNLILEVRKPLMGDVRNRRVAEFGALIESLNTALMLELKRVTFFCDYKPLYQFVTGRWPPQQQQRKIVTLIDQVMLLQRQFTYCNPSLVARNSIKFAFKLAREAIDSQLTRQIKSRLDMNLNETCVICFEDCEISKMFSVDGCLHRYCVSCMKQHIEVKLLHGMVPKCPHEGCKSEIIVDSCKKFLTPKLIETMERHIKEASIPVLEKIYCPYPTCSALMSKSGVLEYTESEYGRSKSGARKCIKCRRLFCINCKVHWHMNMNCQTYRMLNPSPPAEDVKLKSLATRNLWRQCVKCNHIIELSEGCYHMTCRCGYEFCYNCGGKWKNKKATCSCPLWDEDNIMYDREFDEDEDEDEDEDDYDDWY